MSSNDFIRSKLNEFIKRFSQTRVRYEYDHNALVHVVEVLPNEVYHSDSDYIQWEDEISHQFIDKFPTENICFISDDAIAGIENPELALEGLEYAPFTSLRKTIIIPNTNIINKTFDMITFYRDKQSTNFEKSDIPATYIESNISKAA